MRIEDRDTIPLTQESVINRFEKEKPKPKKREVRSESPPRLRPSRYKPWRTIFLSFFLLFAGILFVTVGINQTFEKGIGETYPYFLLGVLLLIPGIYHGVIIICIWIGVSGFTYEMLPKIEN